MPDQWYYTQNDERQGPVTPEQLKQLATSGQLQPTDLIWAKGMPNWVPAQTIKGLTFPASETPPPLPVSSASLSDPLDLLSGQPQVSASVPHTPRQVASGHDVSRQSTFKKSASSSLKFDWKNWDIGVTSCVAAASMLIAWVDIGLASANGLSQGTFLFLGVFVYPLIMLLKSQAIHVIGGIVCGAIGIVCSLVYIASCQFEIFGHSGNAASGGPYIFLLACVALIVGVVKYKPAV